MERIQSAISKAREARRSRDDRTPANAPANASDRTGVPAETLSALEAADAAWAGLMEFRPDPQHLDQHRVVALTGNAASAPFDSLRTRLLYLMRDKGWRRLAITSPGPACGKTTVALNLALSLARLPDVRTVVIDADLRRPALGRTLGTTVQHQIADVLAGKADPAAHLLRVGPNLALGTNRAPVRDSAELLQGPAAAAALERIEAVYQPTLTIFDLPPMLVSDDAMSALSLMDCAILAAAAETTTVAEIDRCERDMASRTNVAGVVLNKCRYLEKSEGYGYGYY